MPSKPRNRRNVEEIAEGTSRGIWSVITTLVTIVLAIILIYVIGAFLLISSY